MAINKRHFLQFLLSASASLLLPGKTQPSKIITSSTANDVSQLHVIQHKGNLIKSVKFPFQPHSYLNLPHNNDHCLIIGKRPSDLMAVVDTQSLSVIKTIQLPYGRHFYGHGTFSIDGDRLFISENDFEHEKGLISVWDTKSLRCLNTFDSGGIGPHQLLISKKQLFCANGGLMTSPLYHRSLLSDQVDSNISVFDQNTCQLLNKHSIEHPHMSARHMCRYNDGILIGFQHKSRSAYQQQPLFMSLIDDRVHYFSIDEKKIIHGHVTSIIRVNSHLSAASLHKDHTLVLIDNHNNHIMKTIKLNKPQGLITDGQNILCSCNDGLMVVNIDNLNSSLKKLPEQHWDNHFL